MLKTITVYHKNMTMNSLAMSFNDSVKSYISVQVTSDPAVEIQTDGEGRRVELSVLSLEEGLHHLKK